MLSQMSHVRDDDDDNDSDDDHDNNEKDDDDGRNGGNGAESISTLADLPRSRKLVKTPLWCETSVQMKNIILHEIIFAFSHHEIRITPRKPSGAWRSTRASRSPSESTVMVRS